MKRRSVVPVACIVTLLLTGCANLTVTKVQPDDQSTKGLRYSLPKPFIHVVPQADGTIAVDVLFLPDAKNTYAISASSFMSSYAYQVSLDQNGLLNAVEFKQSTSPVGQQVAATAGAVTAQAVQLRAAQLVAAQTYVDSAQTALDTARTQRDQAKQALDALRAANAATSDITKAQTDLAKAEAALTDAQQVLDRAKQTARAVAITASTGTPITTSAPTPSTGGFGPPNWTAPPIYNISGNRGGVLFAIDEGKDGGVPYVRLKAAKIDKEPQEAFNTTSIASGPATLKPQNMTFAPGTDAVFFFSQDVKELGSQSLVKVANPPSTVPTAPTAKLDPPNRTVTLPISNNLSAGTYKLTLLFKYPDNRTGLADVTFSVK